MILPELYIARFNHHVFNEDTIRCLANALRKQNSLWFDSPQDYICYGRKGRHALVSSDSSGEFCLQLSSDDIKTATIVGLEHDVSLFIASQATSKEAKTKLLFMVSVTKDFSTELLNAIYGEETVKKLSGRPANPIEHEKNKIIQAEVERIYKEARKVGVRWSEAGKKAAEELKKLSEKTNKELFG